MHQYVDRLVNLLDPAANVFFDCTQEEAERRVGSGDLDAIRGIGGQWAVLHKDGQVVRMARSIGRPMRYFLAKRAEGPCLIVAERMDEIRDQLAKEGLEDQFRPSYTRMVPAHWLTELRLIGCPDPNPKTTRFFDPPRGDGPSDIAEIGRRYVGAVAGQIDRWLDTIPADAPVGVLFSGGVDSGAVLLLADHLIRQRGQSPARLKAFTMTVDGTSPDADQAFTFLDAVDRTMLLETVDVPSSALDVRETIAAVEDYKPLDIEAATMGLALCRAIRERYPDWTYLLDGDGGDENLKDYPIEANPELTIRSVLSNSMLYQEGWGVEAVKHSLTYSGGQSRGHVRTYAPARRLGFSGFSPYATPAVIEVAEAIPFIELTDWDHGRLYALKGQVVRAGVEAVTGVTMPVYEKRRFQHGAAAEPVVGRTFAGTESEYRRMLTEVLG